MNSASVGFQCPDDVAAGQRTVRQPRTVFGGRVSGDTSRVSITLIAINVAVFVLGLVVGAGELQSRFGMLAGPAVFGLGGPEQGVATGQFYRLITAAFLHAGVLHLALNMFALAQLGPLLESALGRTRFLSLYLLSALGGTTLSYLVAPANTLGVGASGALFGLFGAYYVVVRRLGGPTGSIVVLLAINLVLTFSIPIIDWRAHVGGLITGALLALAFAYAPSGERRTVVQVGACVVTAVLLVGCIVGRSLVLMA